MKKSVIKFPGRFLLPVFVFGIFIASCASNDTNPSGGVGSSETDTTMAANTDTMVTDQTHMVTMDTSSHMAMVTTDSLTRISRDTAAKSTMDKKGKKGKVIILPADPKANTAAMEMDKEGFYKNTEILPAFPGGQKALERYFEDNIVYPDAATENGSEGTVKLTFAVDENGKVYNPVVIGNPIGYGLEEEAIRVFKKMPVWTPGRIKGKNVKTRYTLPIRFQLY